MQVLKKTIQHDKLSFVLIKRDCQNLKKLKRNQQSHPRRTKFNSVTGAADLPGCRLATFRSSCGIALAHWPCWFTGPGRITVTLTSSHLSGICSVKDQRLKSSELGRLCCGQGRNLNNEASNEFQHYIHTKPLFLLLTECFFSRLVLDQFVPMFVSCA